MVLKWMETTSQAQIDENRQSKLGIWNHGSRILSNRIELRGQEDLSWIENEEGAITKNQQNSFREVSHTKSIH
jgi:hypothetical protein